MSRQRDVIIIGSGLSGASAALTATNAGLDVIAFSKPTDPGYWLRTKALPQFPGAEDGISGEQFIGRIKKQAEAAGATFQSFEATQIKETDARTFRVSDGNGDDYEAPVVIIATGISKDEHMLAGEKELVGKGVYYSVENGVPTLKHQSAVIIGKSERAAEAAVYLSKYADKISFVIPSSKLDAPDEMLKELEANKKVELYFSSSIKKLNGNDELHSVTILNAGSEIDIKARSAFIYTHNPRPSTSFAKNVVAIDEESGRVLVNSELSTSRPGIFACGDVLAGELQNPAVSIAQGTIAALNSRKFLKP